MKRLVLFAAVLLFAGQAVAQSWTETLKKVATTAIDNATDGKLTQAALVGTWKYTAPGIKFESDDTLSELGATAIESTVTSRLTKAYQLAGIKPGTCTFTFASDASFSATTGKHTLSGTYEFDASTHVITLHFAKGSVNLGSVPGHAYISGEKLQLVFPVTKLVDMVTKLGSRISSLATVTAVLEKYKDVYIGFEFGK